MPDPAITPAAWIGPHGRIHTCDECGESVPPQEMWQQPVEGGAGMAYGHRACIEAEWGPEYGSTGADR